MAKKSTPFTLEWLEQKGFRKSADGDYVKAINTVKESINKRSQSLETIGEIIAKQPIVYTPDFTIKMPLESFLNIPGIVSGLNNKGLMDTHWSKRKKQKDLYRQIIQDQIKQGKIRRHLGKVKVTYIGYKSSFMDWDNFASSAKYPMDGLVKEKVIIDDNPNIVVEFIPKQIKCKRVDQKVIIIIEDINQ